MWLELGCWILVGVGLSAALVSVSVGWWLLIGAYRVVRGGPEEIDGDRECD